MRNLKSKKKQKKVQAVFLLVLFFIGNFYLGNLINNKVNHEINNDLKISGTYYDASINDLPGSLNNWSWAETQPWVSGGNGSINNPYIIDGHTFEYSSGNGNCLTVVHSRKHFKIQNCTFRNSDASNPGIYFDNVTNGQIIDNEFYNNYYGLYLRESNYTLILRNDLINNNYDGLYLIESHFSQVLENNISSNTHMGIRMDMCTFDNVSKNIIKDNENSHGIYIGGDNMNNTVSENSIITNGKDSGVNDAYGIMLSLGAQYNNITNNIIIDNDDAGIYISSADKNLVKGNIIKNNPIVGIKLTSTSDNNKIYENYFKKNGKHAEDSGNFNTWNSSIIGNYWDNYTGYDDDLDGIGDTPHNFGTGIDNLPIWNFHSPIHIDDSPASPINWAWAETQPWCSGFGTFNDPYIIDSINITARGVGDCLKIEDSYKYFIVQNCKLIESGSGMYDAGIHLDHVGNGTLINNNCSLNNNAGIILYEYCFNNTISGNYLTQNIGISIWLRDSDYNNILDNKIIDNSDNGVHLYNCNNNTIDDNEIINNSNGIRIHVSYDNNVTNNDFFDNSYGISLRYGHSAKIFLNNISGNNYGIYIDNTRYCDIHENTIENSVNDGIWINDVSADNNTIYANDINSNSRYGIFIDDSGCQYNEIYLNYFIGNNIHGYDNGTDNYWDNGSIGNYWDNYTDYDVDGDGIGESPYDISGTALSQDNYPIWPIISPIFINGSATGIGAHNWTWASNQLWCSGSGYSYDPYIIEGCTIDGKNTAGISCIEIVDSDAYFEIKNCTLLNANFNLDYAGIKLSNTQNGELSGNIFDATGASGILVNNSKNIKITENFFKLNFIGVFVKENSTKNIISNNNFIENFFRGIWLLTNCSENQLVENYIFDSDRGIHLQTLCSDNIIYGNNISKSYYNGIYMELDCSNNNVTGNLISDSSLDSSYGAIHLEDNCDFNSFYKNNVSYNNGQGFFFEDHSDNSTIIDNTINSNEANGIRIYDYCNNYTIVNNTICQNTENGIKVHPLGGTLQNLLVENNIINSNDGGINIDKTSHYSSFINNIINDNNHYGLRVMDSDYCNFIGNTINDNNPINAVGLYISNCNHATISKNEVHRNLYGIQIAFSNLGKVSNNSIISNNHNGLYIHNSDHLNISDNILIFNIDEGMFLVSSHYNKIIDNRIEDSFWGIYILNSEYNIISQNLINKNGRGIYLRDAASNNITNNLIEENNQHGIYSYQSNWHNLFYGNYFVENNIDAYDNSTFNYWNSSSIGNYWSKYKGVDLNDDGIGDSPYSISGSGGAKDYLPMYNNIPFILIDEYSSHDWIWASEHYWCSGLGTYDDPYIIEDKIIDLTWSNNRIEIRNSDKYFIIKDCVLINSGSGYSGISLYNTENGQIIDCMCVDNENGIKLADSNNNLVSGNNASSNLNGISLSNSDENDIIGNIINQNGIGLELWQSNYNFIKDNTLLNNEICILEIDCIGNTFENNDCGPKPLEDLFITIIDQIYSSKGFNITFYVTNATLDPIDFATFQMWWDGVNVTGDVQNLGGGTYFVSLEPITVDAGDAPILLNMIISATGYLDKYFDTYLSVRPCDLIDLLYIGIVDQIYTEDFFNITFYITNATGYGIDSAIIQMWWDGADVSSNIVNLGSGFYKISLTPILVSPGEDPIILEITVTSSGYQDLNCQIDIAIDPESVTKGEIVPSPGILIPIIIGISIAGGALGAAAIYIFLRKRKLGKGVVGEETINP